MQMRSIALAIAVVAIVIVVVGTTFLALEDSTTMVFKVCPLH